MTLQYEDIFSVFLDKITEYRFLKYDDNFTRSEMVSWLRTSSSSPRLRAKFNLFALNDVEAEFSFELKTSVDKYSDCEFVKDILARGMVIAWLEPQEKNVELTMMMVGGKEEKYYSQSGHLKEIRASLDNAKIELNKLLRDYGYLNNSYIKE